MKVNKNYEKYFNISKIKKILQLVWYESTVHTWGSILSFLLIWYLLIWWNMVFEKESDICNI